MASSRKAAPADLAARVGSFLAPRLPPDARLCLGYSGGLDSTVLLHLLAGLREPLGFALQALHVHHGLSVHADDWAESCARTCARLGVPLEVRRVWVVAGGEGLEAAARTARYAELAGAPADFVLVAHHADDQAETLLLRLLRGAGVQGLAAMAPERELDETRLLRPFLGTTRAELEDYARRHGLAHVEDDSNLDTALTRNWLRHDVLPVIAARFPSAGSVLARTAERLAEGAALLDDLACLDLASAASGTGLKLSALAGLPPARSRNLLRYWLRGRVGSVPSAAQVDALQAQMLAAGPDRQPIWHWAGHEARRYRGVLRLAKMAALPEGHWCWQGEAELVLGEYGRLVFEQAVGAGLAGQCLTAEGAVVAWRAGGERIQPDSHRPRRTLKNLMREAGLPPEVRQHLPLLYIGGQLAWVAGIGCDCAFQARPGEPGWLISWLPRGRSAP